MCVRACTRSREGCLQAAQHDSAIAQADWLGSQRASERSIDGERPRIGLDTAARVHPEIDIARGGTRSGSEEKKSRVLSGPPAEGGGERAGVSDRSVE